MKQQLIRDKQQRLNLADDSISYAASERNYSLNPREPKEKQHLVDLRSQLRLVIDEQIKKTLQIPDDLNMVVAEFVEVRLSLDKPSATRGVAQKPPTRTELQEYVLTLTGELDDFAAGVARHDASITTSQEIVECRVTITDRGSYALTDEQEIIQEERHSTELLNNIHKLTFEKLSQWVYMQRSLLLFDGPNLYVYKSPRRIDWTRTAAMIDASEIIGHILSAS